MNINKKMESRLKLKISDWELDFYSRPIIESNGKKRWELIICSSRSYKTKDTFFWTDDTWRLSPQTSYQSPMGT